MRNQSSNTDLQFLRTLNEYRLLSSSQLSLLCFPSRQMTRRKLKDLLTKGLVRVISWVSEGSTGRPENVYGLSEQGRAAIGQKGAAVEVRSTFSGLSEDTGNVGHQLLLNWVRLHLKGLVTARPELTVNFLSPAESIEYRIAFPDNAGRASLIPDGICSITDSQQGKSLLFFLEIDMGTESLSGSSPGTVRAKISNYEQIFRSKSYKKFEQLLNRSFRGFRVLFVANTHNRLTQLSRLAKSDKSADFVWLTDQESLFKNGISGKIWLRGGREEKGLFSIIGPTLARNCPIILPK